MEVISPNGSNEVILDISAWVVEEMKHTKVNNPVVCLKL